MAKVEQREREEKWYMLRKRGRQEPDHIGHGLSLELVHIDVYN